MKNFYELVFSLITQFAKVAYRHVHPVSKNVKVLNKRKKDSNQQLRFFLLS